MNPQQMIMCTQLYLLQDLCVSVVHTRCGTKCHTKMTEPCGDGMWHICHTTWATLFQVMEILQLYKTCQLCSAT